MTSGQWTILAIALVIVLIELYAKNGSTINPTLSEFVKIMFSGVSGSTEQGTPSITKPGV